MIKTLYLRNFRKLDEVAIDFHPKVNGIFGANYKGKSTILIAIAVAMAGPAWARGMNLVRRGQDNFEIQMTFAANGKDYRVVRTKSGAKLFEGEKLLANQQGNVNREISTIIGVPVESWLSLRFVRQKQAAAMFEAGAAKLNALVEELTGVRVISLVIDSLGVKSKEMTSKLEGLKSGLAAEDQLTQLRGDLAEATSVIERAQAEISHSSKLVEECQTLSDEHRQKRKELEQQMEQAESARKAYDRAARALELAEAQARAKLGTKPEGDAEALETTCNDLTKQIMALNDRIAGHTSAYRQVARETKRWEEDLKLAALADADMGEALGIDETYQDGVGRLTTQAEGLDGKIEAASAQLAASTHNLTDLKNQRKTLQGELESGVCQSCNRAFEGQDDDHRRKTEERIQQLGAVDIPELTDAIAKQKETVRTLRTEKALVEQELATLKSLHQDRERAVRNLDESQELRDAAVLAFKPFEDMDPQVAADRKDELVELVTELRAQIRAIRQWHSDRNQFLGDLKTARETLADLPEPQTDKWFEDHSMMLEEVISNINAMHNRKRELEIDMGHWKTRAADALRSRGSLESTLEHQDQLHKSTNELSDKLTRVDGLRKFLRDNRSRYLQQAWTLLLARASAFADANTGGIITEILRTDDGKFQFIEEGELADTSDASGAQAAVMGIGVQMALAETLPTHLDVILADEPTADMDSDHSMAAILGLTTQAKQLVLISHHRMDESVCDEVMEL